jgi:hypothetical protein
MHSENSPEKKEPRKKSRLRKWIIRILVLIILGVLILFFAIPLYLSSNTGRDFIVSRINRSIDGQVQMGDFSIGWFKGIRLEDFHFADNAGTTKVDVKTISTKPSYGSLLRGSLTLGKTLVDQPQVVLNIKEPASVPDTETAPEKPAPTKKGKSDLVLPLALIDLEVKQGNATINTQAADQAVRSVHFQNIESNVAINRPGTESKFGLSMVVADGAETPAKLNAKGSLTPAVKKGQWTLKGTNGDFQVEVDNLDLATLEPLFVLADVEFGARGTLNADVNLRIDDGRVKDLDAKATLADFARTVAGKQMVLTEPVELDAQISSSAEQVKIDKLQMTSSFCALDCTGGVNSVDYTAKADLEGLQEFAGQFVDFAGYGLSGSVVEKGNISFDKEKITFKGQAQVESFVVSRAETRTPQTDAEINFDMGIDTAENLMNIDVLKLSSEPAVIQVSTDSITLSDKEDLQFSLNAQTSADLKKVQPFVALAAELPKGLGIAGKLESDVSLQKNKEGYRLVTDATSVNNLVISQPNVEPFMQEQINLAADVLCNPEKKTVEINTLNLESKQDGSLVRVTKGSLSETSEKDQTKVEGKFQAEYDLETIGAMASAFVPEGLVMQGKRTANLEFQSQYPTNEPDKLTQNLNGKASFGFDKAEYMGLNIGTVNTELEVKQGLLTLKPFTTQVNNGKLTFAGSVNLREEALMLKTPGPMHIVENIDINDKLSRNMLKYVNPMFANAVNVHGVADFNCDALAIPLKGATQNDILVEGTVAMKQVRMEASDLLGQIVSVAGGRGLDLAIRPTRFALKDGFLGYDNMQVDIGDNPVNFKGRIGLDKSLDMTVELPYTVAGKTVSVDETTSDRVALAIEGTLDDPRINLEKLLESQIKNIIDDQLRKGIEKLFE